MMAWFSTGLQNVLMLIIKNIILKKSSDFVEQFLPTSSFAHLTVNNHTNQIQLNLLRKITKPKEMSATAVSNAKN